jgi:CDP-diacylglycerol pyrophosphatase
MEHKVEHLERIIGTLHIDVVSFKKTASDRQDINKDTHSSRWREWLIKLLGHDLGIPTLATSTTHNWFQSTWQSIGG